MNLFKNNNIEYLLNQLKFRPFYTLKKNSSRKIIVGVLNCCSWEIDYLLMNAYYGEDMEMK